jgi:hypothetical protein
VISPLRVDVVVTGFVLAIPVLLLGVRGDLTAHDVVIRLLWCLAAGWAAVALVRFASTPPTPAKAASPVTPVAEPEDDRTPAA